MFSLLYFYKYKPMTQGGQAERLLAPPQQPNFLEIQESLTRLDSSPWLYVRFMHTSYAESCGEDKDREVDLHCIWELFMSNAHENLAALTNSQVSSCGPRASEETWCWMGLFIHVALVALRLDRMSDH